MGAKGIAMKIVHAEMRGVQKVLERKEAVLVHELQKWDGIAIAKIRDYGFTTAALELAVSAKG
jgi:hypothetical protein